MPALATLDIRPDAGLAKLDVPGETRCAGGAAAGPAHRRARPTSQNPLQPPMRPVRSNRSAFMTFVQAATKSCTNFS